MIKIYKVISLHCTNKCNLECPFCYKRKGKEVMDEKFMIGLPKYLSKITPQVAVGGGEATLFPELMIKFAEECKKYGLVCNITTNGRELDRWDNNKIMSFFRNIRMVSLSIDKYKVNSEEEFLTYARRIQRLKRLGIEVGANLLIDKDMFRNHLLIKIVSVLFEKGIDRVFALYPKNIELGVNIIDYKGWYEFLTTIYPHFYVDDCTRCILNNEGYSEWKGVCHKGKDILSVEWDGSVSACSFAKPFATLRNPEDILSIEVPKGEMGLNYCPHINRR